MCHSFRAMVAQARRRDDLYFATLLPENLIMRAFGAARARWQGWVYTPAVTVWVFLSQCFSPDHSCREAVARLMAWRVSQGLSPCSAQTGAYCTARGDLPEEALHTLVRETGALVTSQTAPAIWLTYRVHLGFSTMLAFFASPDRTQSSISSLRNFQRLPTLWAGMFFRSIHL